ncbi:MAG: DUF1080 domain-containing protein [Bryobacteraceae bacterium]
MRLARRAFLGGMLTASIGPSAPAQRSLFDGSSEKGWRAVGGPNFPHRSWTIEGACLKALEAKPAFQDLRTIDEFSDFELDFEWKIAPAGNSGVKYLIYREDVWKAQGSEDFHARGRGFEFQIADDGAEADAVSHAESRSGALYGFLAPAKAPLKPVGEFNSARIIRRGPHIQHWLNGKQTVQANLNTPEIRELMRRRKVPLELPARSPIVLQNHSSEAWFRNLQIRTL